ncbi:AAA family ATPase [Fertoebacter nigrum]|uniref:AAA family ATPase n=1 Tax=Fertoeibacter niger TaxID=2656921 RepID=A0A8X8KPY4_9RHOB|nr:AAA family ATPase [Fertoeibacter niger]NUB46595.1 AAA family ATPase [Fertoeibacter niger]
MRQDYLEFLLLDPRRRAQTRPPDRHLPSAATTLDLALRIQFDDKCAFCERKTTSMPYRFRPTSEALPILGGEGALAYGWLADVWQNLYPICADCRPSPANHFPVAGPRVPIPPPEVYAGFEATKKGLWPYPVNTAPWAAGLTEQPLLLDPCTDTHLSGHMQALSDGLWEPKSPRGAETIRHFQLNRDGLVALRREALAREATRGADAADILSRDPEADLAGIFPAGLEFSGFLESLARGLAFDQASAHHRSRRQTRISAAVTPATPVYSDPPTLVKVAIRGFKGIEDLTITLPAPLTPDDPATALLILGENAAGKSSILEAIALTFASGTARDALIPQPGSLLLDPVFMGGKEARHSEGTVKLTLRHRDGKTRTRTLRLHLRGLSGPPNALKDLPVFAYGAYRHFLKDYRDWTPDRGIVSLFHSDNLLSNPERWLLSLEPDPFNDVIAALRSIFGPGGGFERIEVIGNRCMVVTLPDGPGGAEAMTPLSSVSSGFRSILALTCDVMRWLMDPARGWSFPTLRQARAIVLIDEVEAHLHPRWKVQIMRGLRTALPHVTFIATSHEPLCLRGMKNGEVMVLQRVPRARGAEGLPVKVEQLTRLPDVTNLNIEQLLTSDFFSVADPDDPARGNMLAELADGLGSVAPDSEDGQARRAALIATIADDVTQSLPVGRSEVAMLVQGAVADYLLQRGRSAGPDRARLRDATRDRIVRILTEGRDRGVPHAPG